MSGWRAAVCSSDRVGRRQAAIAGEADALAQRLDGQRVVGELAAHEGAEALQPAGKKLAFGRRQAHQPALAVAEGETDRRMRHGEARKRVLHRSEEHTSGLPSLMRISYAVF